MNVFSIYKTEIKILRRKKNLTIFENDYYVVCVPGTEYIDLFLYTITLTAVRCFAPPTLSYTHLELASRVLLSSKKPAIRAYNIFVYSYISLCNTDSLRQPLIMSVK